MPSRRDGNSVFQAHWKDPSRVWQEPVFACPLWWSWCRSLLPHGRYYYLAALADATLRMTSQAGCEAASSTILRPPFHVHGASSRAPSETPPNHTSHSLSHDKSKIHRSTSVKPPALQHSTAETAAAMRLRLRRHVHTPNLSRTYNSNPPMRCR